MFVEDPLVLRRMHLREVVQRVFELLDPAGEEPELDYGDQIQLERLARELRPLDGRPLTNVLYLPLPLVWSEVGPLWQRALTVPGATEASVNAGVGSVWAAIYRLLMFGSFA